MTIDVQIRERIRMEIKENFKKLDEVEQVEMIMFLLENLRSFDPESKVREACQEFIDKQE